MIIYGLDRDFIPRPGMTFFSLENVNSNTSIISILLSRDAF